MQTKGDGGCSGGISQGEKHFLALCRRQHLDTHGADLGAVAETFEALDNFPALLFRQDEDVLLVVLVADGGTEDACAATIGGLGDVSNLLPLAAEVRKLTSTFFKVHALTSHSRCGTPRTSSSMKRPSVLIRRTRPSVTWPMPETSCPIGLGKRSLKE